jgi:hypothetical protein
MLANLYNFDKSYQIYMIFIYTFRILLAGKRSQKSNFSNSNIFFTSVNASVDITNLFHSYP